MIAIVLARHHLAVEVILPRMVVAATIIVATPFPHATTARVVILDTVDDLLHPVTTTTSVIMAVATALHLLVAMPVALQSATRIRHPTIEATRTLLHPLAVMKNHIQPTVISVERDPHRETMGTRNVHVIGDFSSFALSGFPSIWCIWLVRGLDRLMMIE